MYIYGWFATYTNHSEFHQLTTRGYTGLPEFFRLYNEPNERRFEKKQTPSLSWGSWPLSTRRVPPWRITLQGLQVRVGILNYSFQVVLFNTSRYSFQGEILYESTWRSIHPSASCGEVFGRIGATCLQDEETIRNYVRPFLPVTTSTGIMMLKKNTPNFQL